MTPEQSDLIDRLRHLLVDEPVLREAPMFGVRAFMVNEKMVVCALKDGGLLVRVDAADHDKLLNRPGAEQAVMGPGRDMGPGWIEVSSAAVEADSDLTWWVEVALAYNRTVTGGRAGRPSEKALQSRKT